MIYKCYKLLNHPKNSQGKMQWVPFRQCNYYAHACRFVEPTDDIEKTYQDLKYIIENLEKGFSYLEEHEPEFNSIIGRIIKDTWPNAYKFFLNENNFGYRVLPIYDKKNRMVGFRIDHYMKRTVHTEYWNNKHYSVRLMSSNEYRSYIKDLICNLAEFDLPDSELVLTVGKVNLHTSWVKIYLHNYETDNTYMKKIKINSIPFEIFDIKNGYIRTETPRWL